MSEVTEVAVEEVTEEVTPEFPTLVVRPLSKRLNPRDNETVSYIIERDGGYRLISSENKLDIKVGEMVHLERETGASLGNTEIVGRRLESGHTTGEVPTEKTLSHWALIA